MKLSNLIILFFTAVFAIENATGQSNASISVLTQNSGLVGIGSTVFLEVTVSNTGPASSIGVYKLKVQVAVPAAIVSISSAESVLPSGWTITSNNGSTINLSNGTDVIPVNGSRNILIAMKGNNLGGPSTVSGQLSFSNGNSPGTSPGSLPGNSTADDNSTSTVEVTNPTPIALVDFNIILINCQPSLNWITETEINSDRFQIERKSQNSPDWISVGVVAALNSNTPKIRYSFIDKNSLSASEKVLYRLKIFEKDGRYSYSDVLNVFVNCKIKQVSEYPNPVQKGKLYVSVTGPNGHIEATLRSLSGGVILKTNLKIGTNSLNVSKIASGIYVLSVNEENGINKTIKVVIQN